MLKLRGYFFLYPPLERREEVECSWIFLMQLWESVQNYCFQANAAKTSLHLQKWLKKKTSHRTRFMLYVQLIPVRMILMIWFWSFSSDVSMNKYITICLFYFYSFFLVLLGFTLKCRSGNRHTDLCTDKTRKRLLLWIKTTDEQPG